MNRSSLTLVRLVGVLAVVGLLNGCAGVRENQAQATEIQDQLLAIDGQTWVVGTHLVTISPDASVSGTPSVGDRVAVSGGRTDAGELVIDTVQVLADAQPDSTQTTAPAQSSGAGPSSAQPAIGTSPPESVNSAAPQARAPQSGAAAEHGNQSDKVGKTDKPGKSDKGHKGN